jgi:hypothetical protein
MALPRKKQAAAPATNHPHPEFLEIVKALAIRHAREDHARDIAQSQGGEDVRRN